MFKRMFGATVRAFMACSVLIWPLTLLPRQSEDTQLITMVTALCAGILIFCEYAVRTPGFISFRFAPPYNTIRFIGLATIVVLVSEVCVNGEASGTGPDLVIIVGTLLETLTGGYYSPSKMLTFLAWENGNSPIVQAATLALGAAWIMVGLFLLMLRLHGWPGKAQHFNIWLNMPMFYAHDDTAIIPTLERNATLNLAFAMTLPVIIPWAWHLFDTFFLPPASDTVLTKIWVVTLWAFLPANFVMRAIALWRIAQVMKWQYFMMGKRFAGGLLA